jgi:phage-related minor tail protein
MLNLDSINFTADTSQLDAAAKKIESLGTALSALSVDLNKLDKASSNAAKAQAEANLANAKAEAIISKTAKAVKTKADAEEESTKAVKEHTSVLERQQAILEFMTQGFSKGQSSTLAYAKSTGILTSEMLELQSVLQSQRTLIGGDPFDKSLGALKSLQNEFKVLKEVQRLYNAEIPITQKQMENLALDKLRLIEAMKIEGKSMTEIKNAIRDLNTDYIGLATNINRIAAADDALVKSNNDSAKAMGFLSREMERVDNVITGFNNNLNVTASNRLLKFREQLKLSGVDAVTAANMLKTYEERLKTINSTNQAKSSNRREDELKYLARATSVQLGDIGISLAGGQNPLLVLIQQGDQLRGVLNQVGASGNEMQRALSMAFSQIVTGSKDVVMALGSFVVGAFADSGRAVARFGSDILGVSGAIERLKAAKFAEWAAEGEAGFSKISKAMKVSELAVSALGASIGVFVAGAVASAVALLQVTNANDKLSASLIATGAQFGFTTEYAQGLATVLAGIGATRVDVLNAFSEISKSGKISAESFLQVAEAAIAIERVGGPAIKDTVSLMGELKEKSVETLTKYAEQTGLVTTAQIAYVAELVNSGREISATTEATNILTAAIKEQATITYASLSSMGRLWIDLKTSISDAWGSLQDFTSSSGLLDGMTWAVGRVAANFLEVMHQLARGPRLMAEVAATAMALARDAGNLDTNLTEFNKIRTAINDVDKERQDAHDKQKRRLLQEGEFSAENIKREAQAAADLRKKNSEAASASIELAKVNKLIKDEADKNDSKTLTKQQFINKAIEDKNKLLREGSSLSKEQLAIVEKTASIEWDKANKPKKVPKSDAMKGAEDTANWYKKSIERIDDLKNKTIGAVEQLSKAQVLLMDLGDDEGFRKLNLRQQEYLMDRITEIDSLEKQVALEKELAKLAKEKAAFQQDIVKAQEDVTSFILKEDDSIQKTVKSTELKLALLGKSEEEQFRINEQYELQNKLAEVALRFETQRLKIKQEYDKMLPKAGMDSHIVEYERAKAMEELEKQFAETRDSLMVASAGKFEAEYLKKVFNVGKTLSDAITTALFEGGQAGTKKLKDYIVGVFREKINVSINAVVNSVIGSVFGGGGSSGNSGSSAGGLLSSIFGGGSGGSGSGGIMQTLGSLVSFTGTGFGAGLGATLGGVGTMGGLSAGASLVGTGTLAGATSGIGMMAGAAAPWIAGAMLLKDLMAYKVESKGNGITATLGGANGLPSGQVGTYQEFQQTGGLGGGGTTINRDWGVAGSGVTGYIANSVKTITASNKAYAKALGLTSDSIDTFTKNIEVNLTGLDAAGQQAAIDAALASFSAEQATAAYGAALAGVTREGETTTQTLTRLGTDLTSVNAMFGDLGYTLYDVSVTGAAAASRLVSAFGSLAAAQQQMNSYYENFYSQSEQEANIYRSVQSDLAGVGMNFTVEQLQAATRGDIRSAVDGLAADVGTEQGANRYAAAVKAANRLAGIKSNTPAPSGPTGPQPGTSEYYKPGGEVSGGSASAGNEAADSIANAWQAIVDSIWGEVKRIRELFNGTGKDALAAAKAEFEKATAMARSGDQEAAKALPELSQTMLTLAQGQASTLIELRRAQALTANSLEQTITGIASQYGAVVPAFAGGGNYAGGMALVGEEGPELINFNQGGYVHTAGQTASMLGGNGDLLREIRRLNNKVEQLEAAAISTAISNSKLLKILERVTPNGTTVEVSGTVTAV